MAWELRLILASLVDIYSTRSGVHQGADFCSEDLYNYRSFVLVLCALMPVLLTGMVVILYHRQFHDFKLAVCSDDHGEAL